MTLTTAKDIPEEIWRQVFGYFRVTTYQERWQGCGQQSDESGKTTLLSLCLVCQHFRNIAQPILYRTIVFRRFEQQWRFAILAETLRTNPQLGLYLRTLSIDNMDDEGDCPPAYSAVEDWMSFSSSLRKEYAQVGYAPWMYPLVACVGTFHLALLPNIKVFDISSRELNTLAWVFSKKQDLQLRDGILCERDDVHSKQGNPADNTSELPTALQVLDFKHLKEVRLRHPVNGSVKVQDIVPIILHPTIETLRAKGIEWLGDNATRLQLAKSPPNIRVLELDECLVDDGGLRNIMTNMPRLESLSIDISDGHGWQRSTNTRDVKLNLTKIGNVLRSAGENIKELNLCFLDRQKNASGELGSLQSLTSLRRLGVVLTQLIKHAKPGNSLREVLPKCLEALYLKDETMSVSENETSGTAARRLAESYDLIRKGDFSNLREITMEDFDGDREPPMKTIEGWTFDSMDISNHNRSGDLMFVEKFTLWKRSQHAGDGITTKQRGGWTRHRGYRKSQGSYGSDFDD